MGIEFDPKNLTADWHHWWLEGSLSSSLETHLNANFYEMEELYGKVYVLTVTLLI